MKTLLGFLLLTGCAYAQTPTQPVRRDSVPTIFPPDFNSTDRMPSVRPNNSFYRNPHDPKNVVRATLDNMPIKMPDFSVDYTVLQSYPNHRKPNQLPMPFLKPSLPIVPKKP